MKLFEKYEGNPVLGSPELGVCFDVYVRKYSGKYRMDFSWRTKKSLAVCFSEDGINWSEPVITLAPDLTSGWEDNLNRNCVLYIDGKYKMWYTGQANGHSSIGYAESIDGINFMRIQKDPVLVCEYAWENASVMNPAVIYENGIYRMWYAAGETYEPNVIAYAESTDGINWIKRKEPIFECNTDKFYEQNRVGGCDIFKTDDMGYVMFYIGYEDIHTARICVAKSEDGITGWRRSENNPLVEPTPDSWDTNACYKPSVVWDNGKWMLWYNGRNGHAEYIGLAVCNQRELF